MAGLTFQRITSGLVKLFSIQALLEMANNAKHKIYEGEIIVVKEEKQKSQT